jgi:hypothetical protein
VEVPITGTDAFQNKPGLTHDDRIKVFISNLYRVGELSYSSDVNKFDVDLFHYEIAFETLASET